MVKTITIMDDAYQALKKIKDEDESFSEVIRKLTSEQKIDLPKWVGVLKSDKKRVEEARAEVRRIREDISKDIEARVHRIKR